ncbi:MAG: DinB family protein [Bacteroidia bacterium]
MKTEEINLNFSKTIDVWSNSLDSYPNDLFALKPDQESWSIGQVCQHIISSTRRMFTMIEKCLEGDTNEHESITEVGEKILMDNQMADVQVKVPAALMNTPPQPESKQVIKREFEELKNDFAKLADKVSKSAAKGKEKHPRFEFLNAKEWLQFADIHCRHHLRQKERIDTFIKSHLSKSVAL